MKKLMKKFYLWTHYEAKKFALLYLCLPLPSMVWGDLMVPTVAFVAALAIWFTICDKFWFKEVWHLF